MEIIQNELTIKKPSLFLKLEDGNQVILKSKLIRIFTAYIPSIKRSVFWDDSLPEKKRTELFYLAQVDEKEGVLRLPLSVLLQMNEYERLTKKDKRSVKWIIGKSGQGLETKYTAIPAGEVKFDEKEIEENTEKLKKIITEYERSLKVNLEDYLISQEKKEKKEKKEEEIIEEETEKVEPEDIPF